MLIIVLIVLIFLIIVNRIKFAFIDSLPADLDSLEDMFFEHGVEGVFMYKLLGEFLIIVL